MTTAAARSTTLPRSRNFLKPSSMIPPRTAHCLLEERSLVEGDQEVRRGLRDGRYRLLSDLGAGLVRRVRDARARLPDAGVADRHAPHLPADRERPRLAVRREPPV